MDIELIIQQVRQRSGLEHLPVEFITQQATHYIRTHPGMRQLSGNDQQLLRNAEFKDMIKQIRQTGRIRYGIYQIGSRKREQLLSVGDRQGLLNTHLSSKERKEHYHALYRWIESFVQPAQVVDIACGMNPLAMVHFSKMPTDYTAIEWSEDDAEFLNRCLQHFTFPGQCVGFDVVTHPYRLAEFQGDVALLFKTLDVFEAQSRHCSYTILGAISCPYIIVTFSAVTVGQRPMDIQTKGWLYKVCDRLGYTITGTRIGQELVYCIGK